MWVYVLCAGRDGPEDAMHHLVCVVEQKDGHPAKAAVAYETRNSVLSTQQRAESMQRQQQPGKQVTVFVAHRNKLRPCSPVSKLPRLYVFHGIRIGSKAEVIYMCM